MLNPHVLLLALLPLTFAAPSIPALPPRHLLNPRAGPAAGTIITKCNSPNQIALTFDDGPYQYEASLVQKLNAAGAKATFFVTGVSQVRQVHDCRGATHKNNYLLHTDTIQLHLPTSLRAQSHLRRRPPNRKSHMDPRKPSRALRRPNNKRNAKARNRICQYPQCQTNLHASSKW